MQLQLRADHDHRACRIVHALAEQVLAEAALLALDHVGQRLQGAVGGAHDGTLAAAVVEEGVHRLLKHALLVADDHLGGVEVHQLLEAVVAVDDAAVQVIQVAGGKVAAVEQHQGPQVRRDDRNAVQHHPLGLVGGAAQTGVAQAFHHPQALHKVLEFLLALGVAALHLLTQLLAQVGGDGDQIQTLQQALDRLGSHAGFEGVAVLGAGFLVLLLIEDLTLLQAGVLRVHDHVVLEIDHLFQLVGLHVEQGAQTAGHRLEEPDVDDGSRQVDVAHALAAHAAVGHLHAALVADHSLVLHAAVLAAGAFPVLLRPEDPLAEQAVALGAVGAVVDGLGFLHLAVGPGATDVVGISQADTNRGIVVDAVVVGLGPAVGVGCGGCVVAHGGSPDRRRKSGGVSVFRGLSGLVRAAMHAACGPERAGRLVRRSRPAGPPPCSASRAAGSGPGP